MEISVNEIYSAVFREYPDVMDVQQVSELLGVCDKTVYRLIKSGTLPSMKVGRKIRVTKVDVMNYLRFFEQAATQ